MNETTLVHDQLLAIKFFVPASSRPLISRPRLITLLNKSLQRKLALIVESATHTLLWQKGELSMVLRWLQQTPEDIVRARPRLYLFYVRLLFLLNARVVRCLFLVSSFNHGEPAGSRCKPVT